MNWIFYALVGPVFMAANNIVDKFVLDKHVRGVGAFTIIYSLISLLISFVIFITAGFNLLSPVSVFLIFSAGVIQMVVFLSYFKALTLDEASRVTPIFQTIPFFSLIFGMLFLNEFLHPTQILGFLMIFAGGYLLNNRRLSRESFIPNLGFWLMLLASAGSAAIGIIFKYVVGLNSFWETIAWENLGIGLAGIVLFLIPKLRADFLSSVKDLAPKVYLYVLFNEGLFFLARLGMRYAFTMAPVALVTVVLGIQPFFILAYTTGLTIFAPQVIKEDIKGKTLVAKFVIMIFILLGVYITTIK